MKINYGLAFIIVAVLAIGGSVVYAQHIARQANAGITFSDHVRGNPKAAVTLVEYGDFECPACGQFEPIVEQTLAEYGNQIRFEFRHFPLISIHKNALLAARAAEAAGQQGKFWEMHDALYKNQNAWGESSNPVPYFEKYAKDIGLDMQQYKTQYKASKIKDYIMQSYQDARNKQLNGTPTFFLNGQKMEFSTVAGFQDQIKAALGISASSTASSTTSL